MAPVPICHFLLYLYSLHHEWVEVEANVGLISVCYLSRILATQVLSALVVLLHHSVVGLNILFSLHKEGQICIYPEYPQQNAL